MGTRFSYRQTKKPKGKVSKYKVESKISYRVYTDSDGTQKLQKYTYRKFSKNNLQ